MSKLSIFVQISCYLIHNAASQFNYPQPYPYQMPAQPYYPPPAMTGYQYSHSLTSRKRKISEHHHDYDYEGAEYRRYSKSNNRRKYSDESNGSDYDENSGCICNCQTCTTEPNPCCQTLCQSCGYQPNPGVVIVPYPYPLILSAVNKKPPPKQEEPEKIETTKKPAEITSKPEKKTTKPPKTTNAPKTTKTPHKTKKPAQRSANNFILSLIMKTTTRAALKTTAPTITPRTTTTTMTTTIPPKTTTTTSTTTTTTPTTTTTTTPTTTTPTSTTTTPTTSTPTLTTTTTTPKPMRKQIDSRSEIVNKVNEKLLEHETDDPDNFPPSITRMRQKQLYQYDFRPPSRQRQSNVYRDIIFKTPKKGKNGNGQYIVTSQKHVKRDWKPKYGIVPIPDDIAKLLLSQLQIVKDLKKQEAESHGPVKKSPYEIILEDGLKYVDDEDLDYYNPLKGLYK